MEDRSHKLLSCLFAFCTLVLSGCSSDTGSTFSALIDFSKDTYPEAVAEVTGLSIREDWGRWSDADVAPKVTIRFKKPLPKTFAITLVAQANEKNDNPVVRVGSFEQEIFIQSVGEQVSLDVDLHEPADTIEIIPPHPASPKELGINSDRRKLGVGLYSLKVEE